MEIYKKDHKLCRKGNSKLLYGNSGKNSRRREDYTVAHYYVLIQFCFHNFDRLTTDLPSLHGGWLCKNSSALIYGADHIFHKLKMTTSRHVLMNKSHRFWVFPLKQKQKQTSPNYILSYILNCFKHMLISQKPGTSSFSVPDCSILPQMNPPQLYRGRHGLTRRASEAAGKTECLQPPPQSRGLGEAWAQSHILPWDWCPLPGSCPSPGSGKTWMGWQQETWMLSDCHHPSSSFCLGWAHSPIVFWSPPREPEPT